MQVFDFLWAPTVLLLVISCGAEPSSNETLSQAELIANQAIMDAKTKEYPIASRPIYETLVNITKSTLFQHISQMPKGAVLHAHERAMCSIESIIQLTFLPNAMICRSTINGMVEELIFSEEMFASHKDHTLCVQCALLRKRQRKAMSMFLREQLILDPTDNSLDDGEVVKKLEKINYIVDSLLLYAPAWKEYFYNSLEEFLADGVQYVEFRSPLAILYDLHGNKYTEVDTLRICNETLNEFMEKHPDFIGFKVIYAPPRAANSSQLTRYTTIFSVIKAQFPDFVAGFDVSANLQDFALELLAMPGSKDFFLDATAINWFNAPINGTLFNDVLNRTQRIDNALIQNHFVLEYIKKNDIAVEILPLSNHVLANVSSNRLYSTSHYFADNYPVVVSSEYPSIWNLKPLSHDLFMAFLGKDSDLKFLKKLVNNSINYSSLSATQKENAIKKWQLKWNTYIASFKNKVP